MRRHYSTLLALMAAILCLPQAWAVHTDPVSLPWTPEIGRYNSQMTDFNEYLTLLGSTNNCTSVNWYSNSFRFTAKASGSTASPNMNPINGYLFLPPMQMEAGECYRLQFAASSDETRCAGGSFKVFLAAERTEQGAENGLVIMPSTQPGKMVSGIFSTYDVFFSPTVSGVQSIVFKADGPGGSQNLYIRQVNDYLKVSKSHATLPKAPSNLTATPDPDGRKEVNVSFTAPTKTVLDADITEMTFINVLVDGNVVEKVLNPVPGQSYTVTIKSSQAKNAKVQVQGGNTHGVGDIASIDCTIGKPIANPAYTELRPDGTGNSRYYEYNMRATYTPEKNVVLNWLPVAGDDVLYAVRRNGQLLVQDLAELTYTDENVTSGFPTNIQYELLVSKGGGEYTSSTYSNNVGLANQIPYQLGFSGDEVIREFTWIDHDSYKFNTSNNNEWLAVGYGDSEGDWCIFPQVEFDPTKFYKIEVRSANWLRPVHMEVRAGKGMREEDMTVTLLEEYLETQPTDFGGNLHTGFFKVPEACALFPAVHVWTDTRTSETSSFKEFRLIECDNQLPAAVTDMAVQFNPEDIEHGTLSFKAPVKSIADEDLTAISKIEVFKNGVLFNTIENPEPGSLQTVTIDVKVGEQLVYKMVPVLGDMEGVATEIPVCVLTAPYSQEFKNGKDVLGWTTIDLDSDGFSWNAQNGTMRAYATTEEGVNDWFITPPMHLQGGYFYKFQYTTNLETADQGNSTSTVGLYIGDAPTAEAMTTQIVADYAPRGGYNDAALVKDYYYIPEDGEYYLGWLAKGNKSICIDNFTVSDVIKTGVPNMALDLTITPDPMGGMSGEIAFRTPATTLKGDPLYGDINYVIYRDGQAVKSLTSSPNKNVKFTDTGMSEGVHLYSIYPTNTEGLGREAENVAFFGINRPYVPENFDVRETDTFGTVLVTWDAPSRDYDGFPINPALVTYDLFLYLYDQYGNPYEKAIASGITDLQYKHTAKQESDKQDFLRYGIRAVTKGGKSPGLLARYVNVGKPYTLPVKESFKGNWPDICTVQQMLDGYAAWGFGGNDNIGVTTQDGDDGMMMLESVFAESGARLMTGKFKVSGENPFMTFYVYNYDTGLDNNVLAIEIGKPEAWTTVVSKTVDEWAQGLGGWQKVTVDLTPWAGTVQQFAFNGTCNYYKFIHIDNITWGEELGDDLGLIDVVVPTRVNPGSKFDLTANYKNNGSSTAEVYTMRLFRDGNLIASQVGEPLAPGQKAEITFQDELGKGGASDIYTYTFDLRFQGDMDMTDNRIENVRVQVRPSELFPTVENLTATEHEPGSVTLTWEAPQTQSEPTEITDDFEAVPDFTNVEGFIGDYLNWDVDKLEITSLSPLDGCPIAYGSKQGWFLMPTDYEKYQDCNTGLGFTLFDAHSGKNCLAAAGLANRDAVSNDWLVSPELTGEAQTLTFWVRSCHPSYLNDMQVLASQGSLKQRDFEAMLTMNQVKAEWQEVTVELPAGTKYFAIRNWTVGGLFLMVDDITYTPAGNERLSLEGIKVYHNGQLLETLGKEALTHQHLNIEDGAHDYGVAAVYNLGESADAKASVTTSSLGGAYADAVTVYGADGFLVVKGSSNAQVTVYDASGATLQSFHGDRRVSLAAGVYLVKVGDKSFKAIVK